jgi:hypothetical protein
MFTRGPVNAASGPFTTTPPPRVTMSSDPFALVVTVRIDSGVVLRATRNCSPSASVPPTSSPPPVNLAVYRVPSAGSDPVTTPPAEAATGLTVRLPPGLGGSVS